MSSNPFVIFKLGDEEFRVRRDEVVVLRPGSEPDSTLFWLRGNPEEFITDEPLEQVAKKLNLSITEQIRQKI